MTMFPGEQHTEQTDPVPQPVLLHPGWLVPMTIIAGLAASGPLAGATLFKCGYRKVGTLLGVLLSLLGIGLFAGIILWGVEWYWATLTLTLIHLMLGVILFFVVRKPYLTFRASHPVPLKQRGTYREVIAGIVGGAFISGLLGIVSMIAYILFIDWLFSTLMPVASEDEFAMARLFAGVFFLTLSGAIAGGGFGWFKRRMTAGQIIVHGFALVWVYYTWSLALEGAIAIPGFQAGAATGEGWQSIIIAFSQGNVLVGFWWSVFLLAFMMAPSGKLAKLGRAAQVIGINCMAAITLAITLGVPADMFLALGRHFERQALPENALWYYERGLSKEPKPWIASYLQYRVALLNHKLGKTEKAQHGFKRVVAKYTWNEELVKKANRFLENLDHAVDTRRVMLPGVETRTEYKGGYCVPNSLALAMRYWGSDVTARIIGKRITGLGSGTFAVNQRWFAEQEGFRHDFLPMASVDDIKRCIDAGFPVLVYVPSHVFAIFGYDEGLETFVTYDVATHDVWVEYLQKDFIKAWKKRTTTLVLAYPPDQESLIPEDIRQRLTRLSDKYLHFQLHFLDAPTGSISVPHLQKAAGETGEFFFPVTILYTDFPGLRERLTESYDVDSVGASIRTYFWDDFDEGVHLWGQYHDEQWAWPDWNLRYSIHYLSGQKRFDLVEELITHINEQGQISEDMLAEVGMIDLAYGEFDSGLDRLNALEDAMYPFYIGLTYLKTGNAQGAIRELAKAVSQYYSGEDLDDYGFPPTAVAHRILAEQDAYGESKEMLEEHWKEWIHYRPFDAPIAEALASLYERRLEKLNDKKGSAAYQRLERKLNLARSRASRYNISSFAE